jgi:PAS domain S-box-containing protein
MFRLICDVVPQPLWVIDHQGLIMYANPAAAAALGYDDPGQLRGKPSHETIHYKRPDGTPYPRDECRMLRPMHTGYKMHGDDDWFVRRDGSMFPTSWWSGPIDVPGGRGAVWAFADVTERLAAEKMLRERDAAEIRAAESRAAQRRILDSANAARRQLARDLHDGAQQRLVTLLLGLQMAQADIGGEHAAPLLDDSIKEAHAAIDELRELAAGIHPSVLTTHGLAAAVKELAARSPMPTAVVGTVPDRLPEDVEASAYFLAAEALTNVVKHAKATRAVVSMKYDGQALILEISDDGIGGASLHADGSGLMGMADRASALGGQLTVDSPPGGGTRLRATLPAHAAH